jgi:hypothetical protein
MYPLSINFTAIEANSLSHRMSFLATECDLDELFDEGDAPLDALVMANFAAFAHASIESGHFTLTLECDEHLEVLIESIEGAVVSAVGRDEVEAGRRSRQSLTAIRQSLASAAKKIEKATGRDVRLPG